MKSELKKIYCPTCGRYVLSYDGKYTMNHSAACRKCKKLITFYPEYNDIKISEIPKRQSSSGKVFW